MRCPSCNRENPPGARFCLECGVHLVVACGRCRRDLPPGANFCPSCGEPVTVPRGRSTSPDTYTPKHLAEQILLSRSALEGERKHVTVLFADLKGSMEMLAARDAEEARRILDPVLEVMMEAVHHYEGTVNQVMGDGVMALFGAPLAHEDHAVRACYAALRMQEGIRRYASDIERSHGVPIAIRIGINSGDVVVRSIGNDLQMDYTAVGQTTHLAARLEQMAEAGSILASVNTVQLVEGYVETESRGGLHVRGLEEPVIAYAITGIGRVRWRLEAAAARGFTSFVGRDEELTSIRRALEKAAEGHGQVIAIVGEPGVGKSRLLYEATRPERLGGWLVLRAGAASYGKATAYRPIVDLLRAYFDLHDQADPRDVRDKITTKLVALGEASTSTASALLSLFEVPIQDPQWQSLAPRQRRQHTMDAVSRLLLRESQIQCLCLVFEDLHWIDFETQAFLDTFIESLPVARILLLVNYRPEYRHEWGSKTYYGQLRVDPLPTRNAQELLRALLGDDRQLQPLQELLIQRTDGNPFFLEESVRALVEDGVIVGDPAGYRLSRPVQEIRVPATVQAVLAARIDRLDPETKRVLLCAAVIGENVPFDLLKPVADLPEHELRDCLARLRAAELVYDISLFPEPYHVFKHGLTRQVAYDSLLRERRRALHGRIVDAIEGLYPDRLGEHAERLAHHARNGELWERAAHYLQQAGAKAFGQSANHEAVAWYEQALDAVQRLPETPDNDARAVDLRIGLRNALTLLGEHERALEHLRAAQTVAERLGDRRRLGRALSFEVNCLLLLGDHEHAIDSARRARAIADELHDVPLRIVTDIYAGRAHLHLGEFARAIEIFLDVLGALDGPLAHDHLGIPVLPAVFARSHLVECLAQVGRFDDSARYASEAVSLAELKNHPDTLLWAYHGAGIHHLIRGEARAAIAAFERADSVARAHDMPVYRPRISAELGLAQALDGHAIDAISTVQQAAAEAAVRRQADSHSQALLLLGEIYLLAQRLPEASEAATSALSHFRRQRARGHEARTLRLLGDITSRKVPADVSTAETYYADAHSLAEKLGMHPLLALCALSRARLFAATGRKEAARQTLQTACARLRELGMTADLERAEADLRAVMTPC